MPAEGPFPFGLIETLRWTRSGGFWLLERHLARLSRSAGLLGHAYDEALARARLGEAVTERGDETVMERGDEALRLRLVLSSDGGIEITVTALLPLDGARVWTAAVADVRLDSADGLLAHKTTRRAFYDDERARLARERGCDEALFLNTSGELCEGGITSIFVERDGVLLTPPLSRGLLPGVWRGLLIDEGLAREAALGLDDLRGGFFLGNSLRGLIAARLAP
jgi:branched-subunit amino acid aminotransferase/4-amino-4-deoxychorismate lyase